MACGQADFHSLPLTARGFRWYPSPMDTTLHPVLSIRLFKDEKCFGPGIAQLLERVEEHRSLRAAAQSMEMAYSKAWRIIRTAEAVFGCKLLSSTIGGAHGGGAVLTPEAERLLAAYEAYCADVGTYAQERFQNAFRFYPELDQSGNKAADR